METPSPRTGGYSSAEGTSGAADRNHLRGGWREAALVRTARLRGVRRRARKRRSLERRAASAPPADVITSERQEVSEAIGLGQSFEGERSPLGGRRAMRKHLRPLTRETSVGYAEDALRKRPSSRTGHLQEELGARATSRRVSRVRAARSVVLAGRFDCRSRRAARGPSARRR